MREQLTRPILLGQQITMSKALSRFVGTCFADGSYLNKIELPIKDVVCLITLETRTNANASVGEDDDGMSHRKTLEAEPMFDAAVRKTVCKPLLFVGGGK